MHRYDMIDMPTRVRGLTNPMPACANANGRERLPPPTMVDRILRTAETMVPCRELSLFSTCVELALVLVGSMFVPAAAFPRSILLSSSEASATGPLLAG